MYSNFESRVKEIIGIDGTLFPYPKLEPPPLPEFVAEPVEMEMWKSALNKHNKAVTVHESDCFKLYGDLLSQMSEGSKNHVDEMPEGKEAILNCDPCGSLRVCYPIQPIRCCFHVSIFVLTATTIRH